MLPFTNVRSDDSLMMWGGSTQYFFFLQAINLHSWIMGKFSLSNHLSSMYTGVFSREWTFFLFYKVFSFGVGKWLYDEFVASWVGDFLYEKSIGNTKLVLLTDMREQFGAVNTQRMRLIAGLTQMIETWIAIFFHICVKVNINVSKR
jgi:hypothetical protein